MTAYKSGPYVVQIQYFQILAGLNLMHTMKVNCAAVGTPTPGTPATAILMQTAGGSSKALNVCINEFWAFVRMGMTTTITATLANFYSVAPGTDEMTFITSHPLSPSTGGSGSGGVAASEETLTLRSAKGSYMAIDIQEGFNGTNAQVAVVPAATGTWYNVLAQYLLSTGGWVACRDRSFPIAPMRLSATQNEATYRRRYRNTI